MKKIKFTQAYTVNAKGGESYKDGQTVELEDRSADHFLSRGVAEEVEGDSKPTAKAEPPKDSAPPQKSEPNPMTTADKGASHGGKSHR